MLLKTTSWILLAVMIASPCMAHVKHSAAASPGPGLITKATTTAPTRDSRFAPMQSQCSAFEPPRIVAGRGTGISGAPARTIIIDLIVLKNGLVEHPFIVQGGDPALNQKVLETISQWRYRPAMCDGEPSEAEGRIQVTVGDALRSEIPTSRNR